MTKAARAPARPHPFAARMDGAPVPGEWMAHPAGVVPDHASFADKSSHYPILPLLKSSGTRHALPRFASVLGADVAGDAFEEEQVLFVLVLINVGEQPGHATAPVPHQDGVAVIQLAALLAD